jgi:hypothetical protein
MHDRVNSSSAAIQKPAPEAIANVALVLNVSAIVAFAICLGAAVYASGALAASVGFIALCCFAVSLACFAADSAATSAPERRAETLPVSGPMPSELGGTE